MALISAGGPNYETSLLNLDTGNIEILMTVNEAQKDSIGNNSMQPSVSISSFYRDSLVRDCNNWPEKSETN